MNEELPETERYAAEQLMRPPLIQRLSQEIQFPPPRSWTLYHRKELDSQTSRQADAGQQNQVELERCGKTWAEHTYSTFHRIFNLRFKTLKSGHLSLCVYALPLVQ